MNIIFKTLTIEGFQSIGKETTLNLENQGFVMIKGINEYENKASSNGCGKTSLMESMNWCLYGKTSSGVSNVTNRYYPNGCSVSVTFSKDSNDFTITRSLDHKKNKSGIKVLTKQNDTWTDISCRNKSDTDKLIRNTILPFDQDIFLSTIFLSQGFSGRLSSLTPSARKERLEILTNIDQAVTEFKDNVSEIKSKLNEQYSTIQNKIQYLKGQLEIYTSEKSSIEALKDQPGVSIPDIPIEDLQTKVTNLTNMISKITDDLHELSLQHSGLGSEANSYSRDKQTYLNQIRSLESKIDTIQSKSECPTCHQVINKDITGEILNQILTEKKQHIESYKKLSVLEKECKQKLSKIEESLAPLQKKHSVLKDMLAKTESTIRDYNRNVKENSELQAKLSRLSECISNISKLSESISKLEIEYQDILKRYEIADHMLKLITKDFRSYLLQDIVNQMNLKLSEYSKELFGNEEDTIKLSTDDTKLTIMLGSSLFESLSGGEKKKVDLALVLAQRDLALRIAGFQCNILIMDEILENMDETSSNVSLNLLNQLSDEVGSIYLISHNNYSIPVDSVITVIKGKDRISQVSIR